jgi:uncharacterized protein YlzI (FlbEa/FlbD family)
MPLPQGREKEKIMLFKVIGINGSLHIANSDAIAYIEDCGDMSTIYFIGNGQLTVPESITTIQERINNTKSTDPTAVPPTNTTTNNVPTSGKCLIEIKSLMDEEFKYDVDTERDVMLAGDSVYIICSKYNSAKLRMATNIRFNKPVFEGCDTSGWVYYARISAGQIVESDGIDVPSSRDQKIRGVLSEFLDMHK